MAPLKPLPDCEGPKLEPFEHDFEGDDVEFLKILEPDFAAHSKIIKTRIGDKIYSLKFVSQNSNSGAYHWISRY